MKISKIRIEHFRAFRDQTFSLAPYTCLVGANGAGKSTVLAALNVFFREQSAPGFDPLRLAPEDFCQGDTSQPVRITVHFTELNDAALRTFADYARHGELIVTAVAILDPTAGYANVQHFGQRLGLDDFRNYFGHEGSGASAADLAEIYEGLRARYGDLPPVRTKADRTSALRAYEDAHPELCVLIPSRDEFYGANSTGKLAQFVQWIYVPAVKNVADEALESKTSALGKLVRRTVRIHTDVDERLRLLEADTVEKYQALLDENRAGLSEIAAALQRRLVEWAHPDVHIEIDWLQDARGSVRVLPPSAGVRAGEGDFIASLNHMGHGLQRSYLLAILQELAASESPDAPTLLLGCEEPELYQHPPQARYLAEVFQHLAELNNQVIVTTHSPLFVSGRNFEDVRLVRRKEGEPVVAGVDFIALCDQIRLAGGDDPSRPMAGLMAKIAQGLQPHISELFFAQVPVLVEGLEEVAYLTAQLHLLDRWTDFRRLGCHLIAVNGKDKLIQPLAIARELEIPVYVVFDADGDNVNPSQRPKHEKDNIALLTLLGVPPTAFPDDVLTGSDHMVWPTNLTDVVRADTRATGETARNAVRRHYGDEGGLEKNAMFIAEWVSAAADAGAVSARLSALVDGILTHAATVAARS
jgi:energy-coupling factor transporter ATP-binding protein EcfA2